MILELDLEGSVVLKLGGASSGDLVHFVEAGPGEADLGGSIVDVEAGLHGPEGDLAVPTRLESGNTVVAGFTASDGREIAVVLPKAVAAKLAERLREVAPDAA